MRAPWKWTLRADFPPSSRIGTGLALLTGYSSREIVAEPRIFSRSAVAGRLNSDPAAVDAKDLTDMTQITEWRHVTGNYLFWLRINQIDRPGTAMNHTIPSRRKCVARVGFLALGLMAAAPVFAIGTDAGLEIRNSAQATFQVSGVAQTPVVSNATQTFVDELLDVAVVSNDAGPVGVGAGQSGAILQFTITNNGNGSEAFRLVADDQVGGDDFNPAVNQLYLESNGIPGLQTGSDTPYLAGSNDPPLAEDASVIVYVESSIGAFTAPDQGAVQLRAVPVTLYTNAGTDDPANGAFPVVGTSYPGAGDPQQSGGSNVTAVVGTSHDTGNLLIRAEGRYQVSAAVVTITKTAIAAVDPFGGSTLVPGTIITYQIDVTVGGSGAAEGLVITDPLPVELEYQPGTLAVSALPAGEDADDDFAPAGTDNTGFDAGTQTIQATLGDVAGGVPAISITFDAAIR